MELKWQGLWEHYVENLYLYFFMDTVPYNTYLLFQKNV
jgi:hypothetical protein